MAVSSSRSSGPVLRSLSPCGRLSSTAGSPFASTTSAFSSRSPSTFFNRSNSPAVAPLPKQSASAVRFSFDRSVSDSPGGSRSIAAASPRSQAVQRQGGRSPLPSASGGGQKRTCMCSPSTHPGSFRCSLHKNNHGAQQSHHGSAAPYQSNRLNARRSAMTNSLVRIGTVEGELVKRALSALIRPSLHNQRRRSAFQPRPSRLSIMSKAEES